MGVPSRRHLWCEIQMAQIRGMIMGGTWSHFGCCLPGVIGNRAVQALPNESCQQLFDVFLMFLLVIRRKGGQRAGLHKGVSMCIRSWTRPVFAQEPVSTLACTDCPEPARITRGVDPYMAYYACMHFVYYYIFLWWFFNIFHYFQLTAVFTLELFKNNVPFGLAASFNWWLFWFFCWCLEPAKEPDKSAIKILQKFVG